MVLAWASYMYAPWKHCIGCGAPLRFSVVQIEYKVYYDLQARRCVLSRYTSFFSLLYVSVCVYVAATRIIFYEELSG